MNRLYARLGLILALLLASPLLADAATSSPLTAASAWTNQRGSTLYIENVAPNGQLSGYYVNRASGYGCQNTPYPVTGWVLGTAITFTVRWQNSVANCNSITAWTGFYNRSTSSIDTLWQLVVNGSTSVRQILHGGDTFKRTTQESMKSLKKK